jgi:hypothetical protein
MQIFFTTAANVGDILYIGQDDIWLANGFLIRGPAASIDTDNAFHNYRIDVSGTGAGSSVKVYYDNGGSPVITGALVNDPTLNGASLRVGFGDATQGDSGLEEWEYFYHNGSSVTIGVVPEPGAAMLALLGVALVPRARAIRRGRGTG